ncbi:MAG TPA: Rieske 2Fe-2S domain-containing protein [Ktedonobacteraceae bacterium]|nr:Rieske 2Fe-2S domain-containing protein [Ktedonobacteraceae bacterium]
MAGEDQERFEDYLELERYIEDLQAGRVTHPPEGLTPDQARIYRMATLFHSASSDEAAPRPEFVAELQAKLAKEVGAIDQTPAKEPQKRPRVSRRSLLKGGAAAAAVAAASLAIGAGIDHAQEEQKFAAATANTGWPPMVPDNIPSQWLYVTTLDELGNQAVRFSSNGLVGHVVRDTGESSDPSGSKVIAMSAACTHMGCIVNWNSTDRAFHCPCHGGIFTAYGQTNNSSSSVRYLAPLPTVETRVDPDGSIYVRVPDIKSI